MAADNSEKSVSVVTINGVALMPYVCVSVCAYSCLFCDRLSATHGCVRARDHACVCMCVCFRPQRLRSSTRGGC